MVLARYEQKKGRPIRVFLVFECKEYHVIMGCYGNPYIAQSTPEEDIAWQMYDYLCKANFKTVGENDDQD